MACKQQVRDIGTLLGETEDSETSKTASMVGVQKQGRHQGERRLKNFEVEERLSFFALFFLSSLSDMQHGFFAKFAERRHFAPCFLPR